MDGLWQLAGAAAGGLGSCVHSSGPSAARKKVGVLFNALRHLDGDGVDQVFECALHIRAIFGTGFEEFEAKALREFTTLLL